MDHGMVADALSRLDTEMSYLTLHSDAIQESFKNSYDKSLNVDYSQNTAAIAEHQRKDTILVRHIKRHPEYFAKQSDGHYVILQNKKYIFLQH
jgi:hypothetical protein